MNFSGIAERGRLGTLLRRLLTLIPASAVVPILQGPLRGKRWIVGSANHGCWLGSYEFEKQRAFAAHLRPGDVIYDIGAHVGFYTLLAASLTGPTGQVYAFEPFPPNLGYLERHLSLNRITNARAFGVAVADRGGALRFRSETQRTNGRLDDSGDLTVEAVRLDMFVQRETLRPPTVIKIDVEGGELAALQGMGDLLANPAGETAPRIFLATHSAALAESCGDLLRGLGYHLEVLDSPDEWYASRRSDLRG